MSPDQIIAAAVRNRADRMGQIGRLAPVAVAAKAKQNELVEMKQRAGGVIQRVEEMRELRHIPNFFPTPRPVIATMLRHAQLHPGLTVLEPNAGRGDLLDALRPLGVNMVAFELVSTLTQIVQAKGYECRCADFLNVSPETVPAVDRVFMNPPFERGADAEHIRHAHRFLKPGGVLVSVASVTTCRLLDAWADERGGYTVALPEGSFKNSDRATSVSTGLVIV